MTIASDVSIAISSAPPESISMPQLFLLALGVFNLLWSLYLTIQTRRRSIEDEFWFRKVVAPMVIDKTIEFSSKWRGELADFSNKKANETTTRKKVEECRAEAHAIVSGFICLKLFNNSVFTASTQKFDALVDGVTTSFYAISNTAIKKAEIDKIISTNKADMNTALYSLLSEMKHLQKSF